MRTRLRRSTPIATCGRTSSLAKILHAGARTPTTALGRLSTMYVATLTCGSTGHQASDLHLYRGQPLGSREGYWASCGLLADWLRTDD